MQNVLFFIYRLHGGGAERVVSNLTQAFGKKYNIKIVVYGDERKTYPFEGELIRIKLPFSKDIARNNKLKRLIRLVLLIVRLHTLKRKYQITTSISFGEQANIINVLSKRNEKVCLSMRTTLSKEMQAVPKMQILTGFIRKLYNKADSVVVPSVLAASDLINTFNVAESKIRVIYNYVDTAAINKLIEEPIAEPNLSALFNQKVLLNVGRITPAKGQWLLFHLLKRIIKYHPHLKLVIIGEGESEQLFKSKLVTYGNALGLKIFDRSTNAQQFSTHYDIYLLGFDSNPFRYMKQSEVLVFPSAFEGFPNTIIEAMQSGLPVIASDCQSGPREILTQNTDVTKHTSVTELADYGILAPALPTSSIEDPVDESIIQEWEKAIRLMLEDQSLRSHYSKAGLERVAVFEKQATLQKWESLIK